MISTIVSTTIIIMWVIVIASAVLFTISSMSDWDKGAGFFFVLGVVALTLALFLDHAPGGNKWSGAIQALVGVL